MNHYRNYFGFKKEPFSNDIEEKDLLKLPGMLSVKERLSYVSNLGGVFVLTGDVGSGKSTAIRYAVSCFHPSSVKIAQVIATSGSVIDFYRQVAQSLNLDVKTASKPFLIKSIRMAILEIVLSKKQTLILTVDEANLLRSDVLSELHTMSQHNYDSKNLITILLSGQSTLIDKLTYRTSMPLASRVIARSHLSGIKKAEMEEYIKHHLKIAGVKNMLFEDQAVTAIFQASGGLLRKANFLARGGLVAACCENKNIVSNEHIRISATELL